MTATTEAVDLTEAQQMAEDFVEAIEKTAELADAMLSAGLTRRALVVLLHDHLGVDSPGMRRLNTILDALPHLAHYYLEDH